MTIVPTPVQFPAVVREMFAPAVTYLNTASYGLLPEPGAAALAAAADAQARGELDILIDGLVHECRTAFGELTGFQPRQVATGTQVSQLIGLVAQSLPAGSTIVVPENEFTSVIWPFLIRPDLEVRTVPLRDLADAVRPGVDLVAAAVVQSADGGVVDVPAVVAAARASGARVLLDLSQAAVWFPVRDTGADWVVSVGHKWLLGPKGMSFLAGTDAALDSLSPLAAGWYSGYVPLETCYGAPLRQAEDARRFDLSPAWSILTAQRIGLDLVRSIGIDDIQRHNVALANLLRAGLGLEPADSAILSVEVPPGTMDTLRAAKVIGSVRDGKLRLACHLYNTEEDVDRALEVLTA
ncbi:aminotransferase class V-fold PLP-dependent enzyme [Nocardia crassostreae]|uniref:aminotransferase class V-fold PLP-dependent enzyme n=1 Tax=Nocardia crassostreae TaxID=53428 RepID=UPI00083593C5|nr:aminotransferase class V-fold PLP-dependent enzyme [Nocardia crassostreae]